MWPFNKNKKPTPSDIRQKLIKDNFTQEQIKYVKNWQSSGIYLTEDPVEATPEGNAIIGIIPGYGENRTHLSLGILKDEEDAMWVWQDLNCTYMNSHFDALDDRLKKLSAKVQALLEKKQKDDQIEKESCRSLHSKLKL